MYSSEKMRIVVIRVWYWGYERKPIKPKEIISIFKVVIVCFWTVVQSHLQTFSVNYKYLGPAPALLNLNLAPVLTPLSWCRTSESICLHLVESKLRKEERGKSQQGSVILRPLPGHWHGSNDPSICAVFNCSFFKGKHYWWPLLPQGRAFLWSLS